MTAPQNQGQAPREFDGTVSEAAERQRLLDHLELIGIDAPIVPYPAHSSVEPPLRHGHPSCSSAEAKVLRNIAGAHSHLPGVDAPIGVERLSEFG